MARGGNYIQFSGVIDKMARNQQSFLIIDNGDELWFSVSYAPGGLNGAQVGDEVEFEYEEKSAGGKTFRNVKTELQIIGEGGGERQAPQRAPARREAPRRGAPPARQQQAPAQGQVGGSKDDPRQRSIVRQNSLSQANAMLATMVREGTALGSDGFLVMPADPKEAATLVIEVARMFEAYSMVEV